MGMRLTTFWHQTPPVAWIAALVLAGLGMLHQAVTDTRITGLTDVIQTGGVVLVGVHVVMARGKWS